MFALPMIGDETNPVDLLLIEAMQIFYAPLHEWVRRHRSTALGGGGYGGLNPRLRSALRRRGSGGHQPDRSSAGQIMEPMALTSVGVSRYALVSWPSAPVPA